MWIYIAKYMATKLCNIDPEEYLNAQKAHKFIEIFI